MKIYDWACEHAVAVSMIGPSLAFVALFLIVELIIWIFP
jgi:hypothetical protein